MHFLVTKFPVRLSLFPAGNTRAPAGKITPWLKQNLWSSKLLAMSNLNLLNITTLNLILKGLIGMFFFIFQHEPQYQDTLKIYLR